MKSRKKRIYKLHLKSYGIGLLLLSSISLISLGFSTWYSIDGDSVYIDNVTINVADVEVVEYGLKDFGFAIVSNSTTTITSSKRLSVDDDAVTKSVIDDNRLTIITTVDTKVMSSISYDDNAYLTISFSYSGYSSKTNNIIDSLTLYPENYTGYTFSAKKSSKTLQTKNGTTTMFSFPMKTKNDISLFSLALLDSTYPQTDTHYGTIYKVPIVFSFEIDEDTLNTEILDYKPKYNITFGLSESVV